MWRSVSELCHSRQGGTEGDHTSELVSLGGNLPLLSELSSEVRTTDALL